MRLHTLVLEGDKKAEKDKSRSPVYTKNDYLRRKWIESRPPLRNRSFYLCRMIEETLKGVEIDGSEKITICAHRVRVIPGEEKYICDRYFHISIYYLEQTEIDLIDAANKDNEPIVILGILKNALLDIAQRSKCSEEVTKKIEQTFDWISSNHFTCEELIGRLTKRSRDTGLTACVYRVLSAEVGEGWYIKIIDKTGATICKKTIGDAIGYVDRLGSHLYAKAEWRGETFVILERFGKEVFSISVPS